MVTKKSINTLPSAPQSSRRHATNDNADTHTPTKPSQSSPQSPLMVPPEKQSVKVTPTPISPTSAAHMQVFMIFDDMEDENWGAHLRNTTGRVASWSPDPPFLEKVYSFFEHDSLLSSDDEWEDDDEELLGLSFLEDDEEKSA